METILKNTFSQNIGEYISEHKDMLQEVKNDTDFFFQREKKDKAVMTTTCNVNDATFKCLQKLNLHKVKKLDIMDIMPPRMCHYNCLFMKNKIPDSEVILGFNLTACECGCFYSLELHSVLKVGDTLYDITRDFNKETQKYFLPMTSIDRTAEVALIRNVIMTNFGFHEGFIYNQKYHKCIKGYRYKMPNSHLFKNDKHLYEKIKDFVCCNL